MRPFEPKGVIMARHGKYYEVIKKIDRDQVYDPVEINKY